MPVIADRPPTIQQLRQLQRDLHKLAEPFIQLKVDILSVSLPAMICYPDGRIETKYSAGTLADLARTDALWADARKNYLDAASRG